MVVVRFHWERSFDRSYCHKNVGTDGNPFQNSKTYHHPEHKSVPYCLLLCRIHERSATLHTPKSPLAIALGKAQRGLAVASPLCARACGEGERGWGCVKQDFCVTWVYNCPTSFQTVILPGTYIHKYPLCDCDWWQRIFGNCTVRRCHKNVHAKTRRKKS